MKKSEFSKKKYTDGGDRTRDIRRVKATSSPLDHICNKKKLRYFNLTEFFKEHNICLVSSLKKRKIFFSEPIC